VELWYQLCRRKQLPQFGELPAPSNGGRGRVYVPSRTNPNTMKKFNAWAGEAELVVLRIYVLWHLVRELFFHSCR
jgi:hypothetical protein